MFTVTVTCSMSVEYHDKFEWKYKLRSQYIMCHSWWRNQILNLTATHCLISIASVLFPKPVLFTTSKKPMSKSGKGYFAIHFHKIVAQNDDHPVYYIWSLAYSMMDQTCKVFFGSTKRTLMTIQLDRP